jgi:RNase H-like protein
MILNMVMHENNLLPNSYRIYSDSQAAIKAIAKPRRQSGQAIIKAILDSIDRAIQESPQLRITVAWIPGHQDIEGNEIADTEAKKAATDPTLSGPYKHKPLKSAKNRSINADAKDQWRREWNEGTKTATALRRITKRKGVKTGTKLYNAIPSRQTVATLVRLRTGHSGLKQHLYRLSIEDSPYGECKQGQETVEHYLLECRRYTKQRCTLRYRLRKEVGTGGMRVDKLLGEPKNIRHTMEYVATTKRKDI